MELDQEIVDVIIDKGSTKSFRLLVEKYQSSIFTICFRIVKNREESEEIAQDVFIKCFRNLKNLKDRSKFRSWLMRIAYTMSIDRVRLKRVPLDEIIDVTHESLIDTITPFTKIEAEERRQLLSHYINKLEKEQSAVITLFYLEDLPISDIAEITGLSKSNIKVLLFRGRKNLRKIISSPTKNEILG